MGYLNMGVSPDTFFTTFTLWFLFAALVNFVAIAVMEEL
jgi:hypothetical protein